MARTVSIYAPSSTRSVNAALRALGWTRDDLEFVRGNGYSYVVGADVRLLDGTGVSESIYDGGPMPGYTVAYWVDRVLEVLEEAARLRAVEKAWLAALPVMPDPGPERSRQDGGVFVVRAEGPRPARFDPAPVLHRLEEAQRAWSAWKARAA